MKTATKNRMRRLISMVLAFAMTLSLFSASGFSWAAFAAEELSPLLDVPTGAARPTLYIDFLGDNGYSGGGATVPATTDQSLAQSGGPWDKYSQDLTTANPEVGTVFWVGVGIDKMSLFELAKEGKGLTSLELGFYYNSQYVVPYAGGTVNKDTAASYNAYQTAGAYADTLRQYNIGTNPVNQWSSDYAIQEAIPKMEPVIDPDTQELSVEGDWDMLYVSLEKTNHVGETGSNRFAGALAGDDGTTYYVMMLPFVLKDIDHSTDSNGYPNPQVCFRLSRNASAFSMGGGQYGAENYDGENEKSSFGAWEKRTRTPRHNLKEMFSFEGDLNIFTGRNEPERTYTAILELVNADGIDNRAILSDTMGNSIDQNNDRLTELPAGVSLNLDVFKELGVLVSVSVTPVAGGSILGYDSSSVGLQTEHYTFTMPEDDVRVKVEFSKDQVDENEYIANLFINNPDGVDGNTAEMTGQNKNGIDSTDMTAIPPDNDIVVQAGNKVTVSVYAHPDYRPTVKAVRHSDPSMQLTVTEPLPAEMVKDPTTGKGDAWGKWDYTFDMPSGSVDVTVSYEKRNGYSAELVVGADSNGDVNNIATLWYRDYSSDPTGLNPAVPDPSVSVNGLGGTARLGDPNVTPPTPPIPEGRTVTLDVQCAPGYEVGEVWVYNDPNDLTDRYSLLPLVWDNDKSVWTAEISEMPDHNIRVEVSFTKGGDFNATLYQFFGDDGKPGNTAEMWGEQEDGTENHTTLPLPSTIIVRSGRYVTVAGNCAPGYEVTEVNIWKDPRMRDEDLVYHVTSVDPGAVGSGKDWETGFWMPPYEVWVTVTYETNNFWAVMVPEDAAGNPNTAGVVLSGTAWADGNYPDTSNARGASFSGNVEVRPGWYIAEVRVIGDETGTAYTLDSRSGNGYNNGAGGIVQMTLTQPGENVHVYIKLEEGPPPPEVGYTLTLKVEDPDNTGTPLANNWAKVSVDGGVTDLPAVGVTKDYNGGFFGRKRRRGGNHF